MKTILMLVSLMSLSAFAEQVETECPYTHDSESRDVKVVKEKSAQSQSESSSEAVSQ